MGRIKQAVEKQETAIAQQRQTKTNFADILRSQWGRIEAVAPKHLSTERLFNMTVSAVNHNPKLLECDMITLLSCVMRCSALGLEPSDVDGLGRAYILPFYNGKRRHMEATFILGYRGMIELAQRSEKIRDICARAVYEGDEFEYVFGLNEDLRHVERATRKDPETLTHVYMIANYTNGGHHIEVMTRADVESVRSRSKSPKNGPWVTDYEAMAKKSVLRRSWSWLPISVESQKAVNFDETAGGFEQSLQIAPIETPMETEQIPEQEPPTEIEPAPEVEAEVVEEVAPVVGDQGLAKKNRGSAVCRNCGNVRDGITPDATLQDLNQFLCCDKPDYQWQ